MRITARTYDEVCNLVWTVSAGGLFGLLRMATGWSFYSWKLWACAPVAIAIGVLPMFAVAAMISGMVDE